MHWGDNGAFDPQRRGIFMVDLPEKHVEQIQDIVT
jgi:hypothetical protein